MHCLWNYLNNDCEDSAQMVTLACYFLSMFHIGFNVLSLHANLPCAFLFIVCFYHVTEVIGEISNSYVSYE